MREDDQSILSKLITKASHLSKTVDVQTRIKCLDCGEEKRMGDQSPCGSHPVLAAATENTFLVRIGLVPPKRKITGQVVSMKPLTNSPSQKRVDLSTPIHRQKAEADQQASTGDKPIYRRKEDTPSQWGISSAELNRKIDERESGNDPDSDPYI